MHLTVFKKDLRRFLSSPTPDPSQNVLVSSWFPYTNTRACMDSYPPFYCIGLKRVGVRKPKFLLSTTL